MLYLSEITIGDAFRIYAVSSKTDDPCYDFLTAAQLEQPNEHAKLMARLQRSADHGPPRNEEQCKQLDGKRPEETVYEFKTHKLRLFWFYDEKRLILCANGIVKGTKKEQNQAIAVARRWKADYLAAKQTRQIQIITKP
jgi:hypothetical protein